MSDAALAQTPEWREPLVDEPYSPGYVVIFRGLDPSRGPVRVRLALAALFPGATWTMEWDSALALAECLVDAPGPPDLDRVAAAIKAAGDRLHVQRLTPDHLELIDTKPARPRTGGLQRRLRRALGPE